MGNRDLGTEADNWTDAPADCRRIDELRLHGPLSPKLESALTHLLAAARALGIEQPEVEFERGFTQGPDADGWRTMIPGDRVTVKLSGRCP
jgi:hypothetical protein